VRYELEAQKKGEVAMPRIRDIVYVDSPLGATQRQSRTTHKNPRKRSALARESSSEEEEEDDNIVERPTVFADINNMLSGKIESQCKYTLFPTL